MGKGVRREGTWGGRTKLTRGFEVSFVGFLGMKPGCREG